VRLYTADSATTKGLGSYLTLTVTLGSGGSFSSCSGFTAASSGSAVFSGTVATLTSSATTYSTGLGTWTPSGRTPETRTYQVAYTVSPSTPDSAQGGTAAFDLVWEAQNS
jgi:hypothetical protein